MPGTEADRPRTPSGVDETVGADVTIGRLARLPESYPIPRPPDEPDRPEQALVYLRQVAADPVLRASITLSSGSLAGVLDRIEHGRQVPPAKLRRAAYASMRYLSRMLHRPTPFGLLAGVCPVRFDEQPKVRVGSAHELCARPDHGWLTSVLRPLRAEAAVLAGLLVQANDLCLVRDGRLVLPYPTTTDERPTQRQPDRSVRHTPAIALAMRTARTPIRFPELVDALAAAYPGTARAAIQQSMTGLVEQEFLLTDLLPSPNAAEPIAHVLDRLPEHPVRTALAEVGRLLADCSSESEGGPAWQRASTAMRTLYGTDNLVQADLRMDIDLTLPSAVTEELVAAARVAARLRPHRSGLIPHLAEYRQAVVERYGVDTLIPLAELLDPITGLGAPVSGAPHADGITARDKALCALAQRAAIGHQREVVLDDELVERLAQRDETPEQSAYTEACAELLAESVDELADGNFRLALTGSYGTKIGAMYGRFLHVLPELTEPLARHVGDVLVTSDDQDAAQVCTTLWHHRTVNVMQVPLLSTSVISAGELVPREPRRTVTGLHELAIAADHDRLKVFSTSTGRELVPYAPHALSLGFGLPPSVRLLIEIGLQRADYWRLWTWGSAELMPYLPRIRRGRTVLANARWRPDPELVGSALAWPDWLRRWQRWRAEWDVPDVVDAAVADVRVQVDLNSPGELRMLRSELDRRPHTLLYERPTGGEYGRGWADGHANEIVFPLWTERTKSLPENKVLQHDQATVHDPGGEWLYLKVYSPANLHDRVLTRHLPELVARTECDRWFFLRYTGQDGDHLRIRFHGSASLGVAHDWVGALRAAGLASHLVVDGYRPEFSRYGGALAMSAAEHAFTADSEAAVEQLRLRTAGGLDLPLELLLAANHLDLLSHLDPDGWRSWLVDSYPKDAYHKAFQFHRRRAIPLLVPGWHPLRELPGGAALADVWQRRAPRVAAYGEQLRDLVSGGELDSPTVMFRALLHLSHNRNAGIDRDAERSTYAVLRGVAQAAIDRERHGR